MSSATDKMNKTPASDAKRSMPNKMSQASATHTATPRKGDRYHCKECGMAIEVTADCGCEDGGHVHFECCDQEMARA